MRTPSRRAQRQAPRPQQRRKARALKLWGLTVRPGQFGYTIARHLHADARRWRERQRAGVVAISSETRSALRLASRSTAALRARSASRGRQSHRGAAVASTRRSSAPSGDSPGEPSDRALSAIAGKAVRHA